MRIAYWTATGAIAATGICNGGDAVLTVDESTLPSNPAAEPWRYRVTDGQLVEIPGATPPERKGL